MAQNKKKESVATEKASRNAKNSHLLVIENAIVDLIIKVDSDNFSHFGVKKASFTVISEEQMLNMEKARRGFKVSYLLGGSAHNTGYLAHKLGSTVHFLTSIGDDEIGKEFSIILEKTKIPNTLFVKEGGVTCRCYNLITPDGERHMYFYPGSASLTPEDLSEELVKSARMIHITGFLFDEPALAKLAEKALAVAKANNVALSIDVGELAGKYKDVLMPILTKQAAVIFANESEARSLTGKNPEESARELGGKDSIVIVKKGADGSVIRKDDVVMKIKSFKAQVIDTTGAGDAYAGAFLHSHLKGHELKRSGELASFLAAKVVEKVGARLEVLPDEEVLKILQ